MGKLFSDSLFNSIEVSGSEFKKKKKKAQMTRMFPPPPLQSVVRATVPDAGLIKLFLVFGFRGTPAELGLS